MDKSTVPPVVGASGATLSASQGSAIAAGQQSSKFRLNLANQNFILVPANSANLAMTSAAASGANGAQNVSNLIATHHNSIINKGKIMILTTAPATGQTGGQVIAVSSGSISGTNQTVAVVAGTHGTTSSGIAAGTTIGQIMRQQPNTTIQFTAGLNAITSTGSKKGQMTSEQQSTINQLLASGQLGPQALKSYNSSISSAPTNSKTPISIARNAISIKPQASVRTTAATASSNLSFSSQSAISTSTITPTVINSSNQIHLSQQTQNQVSASSPSHHHPNIILNGSIFDTASSKYHSAHSAPSTSRQSHSQQRNHNELLRLEDIDMDNDADVEAELKHLTSATSFDSRRLLCSDEKLDRDSPELWPEQVPGVVNFIASTFPSFDYTDDDSLPDVYAPYGNLSQAQVAVPSVAGAALNNQIQPPRTETDSGLGSGCGSDSASVKKFTHSFDFTDYGLSLSIPIRNGGGDGNATDSEEQESPSSVNGNAESNENSSRNSPVDGFSGSGGGQISIDPNVASTSSGIVATGAKVTTLKLVPSVAPAPKPKPPPKPMHVPEWQRGLDEDEIAMLYGYGSLTTSALLDKVKEIQNLAYQLGLEEEREMARARFLDILGDEQNGGFLKNGGHLTRNDFKFAESKLVRPEVNQEKSIKSKTKTPKKRSNK